MREIEDVAKKFVEKGGKLLTTEQMAKCQDEMQGKIIVAAWNTPCKPFLFVGLSVNQNKIEQVRKHDEYAGYMPDFDFEVKDGEGNKIYMDGHKGTEYFVFDNLETAIKVVEILNELADTHWLKRDIELNIEVFECIRITNNINVSVTAAMETAKASLIAALDACNERKDYLLGIL